MCIRDSHSTIQKFKSRWEGPYIITAVNDNRVTYLIRRASDQQNRLQKVHFSHLRGWIDIPTYLRKYLARNPEVREKFFTDEDEEDEEIDDEPDDSDVFPVVDSSSSSVSGEETDPFQPIDEEEEDFFQQSLF